ncbi:hypothetical protein N0V82_008400 [Gnomoniopsis sp. IMI 355080]|nr:hypothetical protein N0V82_008400 [Gnomoniopsis sp. IMI 355080]
MKGHLCTHVLALVIQSSLTYAIGTDDQVGSNIDYGTFQNPSANVRPRFRYWVNDASHNLSYVAEDVKALARAGAGGLELLGYYLYGDSGYYTTLTAPIETDWTIYGFGSEPWNNLQDTVLSTAKEESLLVDLALGPNQGAGVPAPYNDDGLLWDVAGFNLTIAKGTEYSSSLPGWGGNYNSDTLVAATTGLVVAVDQNLTQTTLSSNSLTDLTSLVDSDGKLNYNFGNTTGGSEFVLFAFYQKHSERREVNSSVESIADVPQSPVENFMQNGSWVVDHFSVAGAQITIDFWNQSLLIGNTTADIREVGNYLWEDSQEYSYQSNMLWTPQLQRVFEERRGYSFNNYIPLVYGQPSGGGLIPAFPTTYVLDEGGNSYIQDYQQTLTELNAEYLQTITAWSTSLGAQFSAQVGYNLPMDMLANIPMVNAPECETLGFDHNIDAYRQFAGPANLAGKRIISSECGAIMNESYQQSIPELLWDVKRSVAGGVNQFVLHGYPVSGDYPKTTWPGFTTFAYLFSEMHGPRQPAWDFAQEWLDWTARTQFVAQTGVPKIDLAFWLKSTSYRDLTTMYAPLDLQTAGYTYEYLSPDNFGLAEAQVGDGVFAPNRQAFKALIVRANDSLTLSGVHSLAEYANQGLPVILSGGIPSTTIGHNQTGNENLTATIEGLTQLDNVHVVPYEDLASSLASLNISPRTEIVSNGSWYTYWRENSTESSEFIFVYNDATNVPLGEGMTIGNISFETTGTPFLYDAWTGEVTALSAVEQSETHTTLQLQLAGNQSVIIGFRSGAGNSSVLLGGENSVVKAVRDVEPLASEASTLSNWTLVIESWGPPVDLYDIEAGSTKSNTSYTLDTLIPWSQISDSLQDVSGRGYYHTTFTWPPASNSTASGAVLDLGAVVHTARLSINGQVVPPLDPTWAKADVGKFLIDGINEVDVVVSTPLGNALRSVWSDLETSGQLATVTVPTPPGVADYGLVQDVRLIPY